MAWTRAARIACIGWRELRSKCLSQWRFALLNDSSVRGRFVYAGALSLILHVALLAKINLKTASSLVRKQPYLSVSFAPSLAMPQEKSTPTVHPATPRSIASNTPRILDAIENSNSADATKTSAPLDMSQLRAQAREYANKELGYTDATPLLHGDYYGTYSGNDNGTFFFHLDNAGHVSGSGQSDRFGLSFIITGRATSDGLLQMTGNGKAGDAKFSGQLNIKTGAVSGVWTVAGFGSGTFAGQHE